MAKKHKPNYRYIHEIYLNEIIFEKDKNSTDVTIFAYYEDLVKKDLKRVDYWCEFSTLTTLLLAGKEKCEPVISAITEVLNSDTEEIPIVVDVENIHGKPLKIDGIELKIYRPMEQDENGDWHEDSTDEEFYIIDEIKTKALTISRKTKDPKEELSEYLVILNNAYKYYLQLLAVEIPENIARGKSGLSDELLHRIAEAYYKIMKKR